MISTQVPESSYNDSSCSSTCASPESPVSRGVFCYFSVFTRSDRDRFAPMIAEVGQRLAIVRCIYVFCCFLSMWITRLVKLKTPISHTATVAWREQMNTLFRDWGDMGIVKSAQMGMRSSERYCLCKGLASSPLSNRRLNFVCDFDFWETFLSNSFLTIFQLRCCHLKGLYCNWIHSIPNGHSMCGAISKTFTQLERFFLEGGGLVVRIRLSATYIPNPQDCYYVISCLGF